ncbi:hypothetical protein EJ06DRAFT_582033 [Trichodelitschia bisporula]|uniref:Uncharacterized protein n=1 Tax=Trichodelitschia bisporula TaxID=703511 RepID=A0A6G1HYA9_9PEZI|nr:hypothetical protein EJ06DRAFT_582033 [Trichodelitschia bisporula]
MPTTLLLGCISLSPPRPLPQNQFIRELLSGDHTASPFRIAFFYSAGSALESQLNRVRPRDVLVVQRVVLVVYRGVVGGRSVAGGGLWGRYGVGGTEVRVLGREGLVLGEWEGEEGERVGRVAAWVRGTLGTGAEGMEAEELPPDTQ